MSYSATGRYTDDEGRSGNFYVDCNSSDRNRIKRIVSERYGVKPNKVIVNSVSSNTTLPSYKVEENYDFPSKEPMASSGTFSGSSSHTSSPNFSSDTGGCFGSIFIFFLLVIGSSVLSFLPTESDDSQPQKSPVKVEQQYRRSQLPENRPIVQSVKPVTPKELENPCKIWTKSNPSLASKLTPSDTCYGF